jgi:hypothetical protein
MLRADLSASGERSAGETMRRPVHSRAFGIRSSLREARIQGARFDAVQQLLTQKKRLLDTGLTAQVAGKKADLDEIRADLKKQYREIW